MKNFLTVFVLLITAPSFSQLVQPLVRNNACLTFDSHRGEVIMFGGSIHSRNPIKMRDSAVWSWNGTRWKVIGTAPTLRGDAIFSFNTHSKKLILNGGRFSYSPTNEKEYSDTWEFDGTTWKERSNNSTPLILAHTAAAYHPELKALIRFGGHDTRKNKMTNETWVYQFDNWMLMSTIRAPQIRCMHTMFYDAKRKGVVVVGGMNDSGVLNDMWILDHQGWRQLADKIPFNAIGPYAVVALGDSGEYFAFISDGGQNISESWLWSDGQWKKLDGVGPSPRTSASMVYDGARKCVVLFGGEKGIESLNEVWEFSVKGRTWGKVDVK